MKISILGHTVPESGVVGVSSGISRYIYHLSKEIRDLGNDVNLFIRNDFVPKEPWITTISSPKFSWFPYPIFAYFKMRNLRSDVFHADYVNTGATLIWSHREPSVVSIHDVLPFTYNPRDLTYMDKIRDMWYMKNFKTIQKADAIIVASEHAKIEALKHTKIPEDKLHAIHYGIDLEKFKPEKKSTSEKIRIGYLGGLDGRKNVILLIECFKILSKRHENIELHIGGTGRNYQRFKSMNLPGMFLHGPIDLDKAQDFLNSLDIFVFPTLSEGFGLPICEAMACGLPVVASNVSTMPEIVGDAGILSNPNVDDMSEAISRLVESRQLREKLKKRAIKRSKDFTWKKTAEETLKVYETVMV